MGGREYNDDNVVLDEMLEKRADPLEELQQTLQDALEKLEELKERNSLDSTSCGCLFRGTHHTGDCPNNSEPKQSEEYPKADDLVWSDTPLKTIDNILNQLYLGGVSDAGTGGAMEDTCGEAKQAILQHFQQEQESKDYSGIAKAILNTPIDELGGKTYTQSEVDKLVQQEQERLLNELRKIHEVQKECGSLEDQYMLGLYNGLEMALSIAEDREPIFESGDKKEPTYTQSEVDRLIREAQLHERGTALMYMQGWKHKADYEKTSGLRLSKQEVKEEESL